MRSGFMGRWSAWWEAGAAGKRLEATDAKEDSDCVAELPT